MSDEPPSFILKIQHDELERQLFVTRSFYVSIKRDWMRGTRVLFVRKDRFIGSGVVDRVIALDDLQESERKLCLESNWYGKILFSKLTRFLPAVSVHDTPAAGQNPLALHGASMSGLEAQQIEGLASKIIS